MIPDISIFTLFAVVFGLLLVFVILQSLRLPKSFFDRQEQRSEYRKQFIKNDLLMKESIETEDDQVN